MNPKTVANSSNQITSPVQEEKKPIFWGSQEVFDNLEKFEKISNPTTDDFNFDFWGVQPAVAPEDQQIPETQWEEMVEHDAEIPLESSSLSDFNFDDVVNAVAEGNSGTVEEKDTENTEWENAGIMDMNLDIPSTETQSQTTDVISDQSQIEEVSEEHKEETVEEPQENQQETQNFDFDFWGVQEEDNKENENNEESSDGENNGSIIWDINFTAVEEEKENSDLVDWEHQEGNAGLVDTISFDVDLSTEPSEEKQEETQEQVETVENEINVWEIPAEESLSEEAMPETYEEISEGNNDSIEDDSEEKDDENSDEENEGRDDYDLNTDNEKEENEIEDDSEEKDDENSDEENEGRDDYDLNTDNEKEENEIEDDSEEKDDENSDEESEEDEENEEDGEDEEDEEDEENEEDEEGEENEKDEEDEEGEENEKDEEDEEGEEDEKDNINISDEVIDGQSAEEKAGLNMETYDSENLSTLMRQYKELLSIANSMLNLEKKINKDDSIIQTEILGNNTDKSMIRYIISIENSELPSLVVNRIEKDYARDEESEHKLEFTSESIDSNLIVKVDEFKLYEELIDLQDPVKQLQVWDKLKKFDFLFKSKLSDLEEKMEEIKAMKEKMKVFRDIFRNF